MDRQGLRKSCRDRDRRGGPMTRMRLELRANRAPRGRATSRFEPSRPCPRESPWTDSAMPRGPCGSRCQRASPQRIAGSSAASHRATGSASRPRRSRTLLEEPRRAVAGWLFRCRCALRGWAAVPVLRLQLVWPDFFARRFLLHLSSPVRACLRGPKRSRQRNEPTARAVRHGDLPSHSALQVQFGHQEVATILTHGLSRRGAGSAPASRHSRSIARMSHESSHRIAEARTTGEALTG